MVQTEGAGYARPRIKTEDIRKLEYCLRDNESAERVLRNVVERKGYFERNDFKSLRVLSIKEIVNDWELIKLYADGEIFKWEDEAVPGFNTRDLGYVVHCRERPGFYEFVLVEDLTK